ncbi:MAG: YihY/virulence factor BrkB family protein [Chloroflexi bacterium]|nr:YihY/virulence factor BrkB family protein [Chloroflexota bacterium]
MALLERTKAWTTSSPFVRNRFITLALRVIREMKDDDATHLAAGVAYYAMFSLFPLLLGFLAISGLVLNSEGLEQKFMDFVTDNLPGSEQIVKENVGQVVRFRGLLGIGAFIGLLWSASAVFGAINRAVNRAWDIRQDRPFYIAKPRQLAMALGVGILFLLSTSATSAIQVFTDPSRDLGVPGQDFLLGIGLGHLALRMVPWAMTLLIFLMVYRFLPDCKTYWRFIWPGAVVASVLFEVAKSLFVWYLNNIATYDQVYGSLTSVMALLFWIYISALILILGAEISSEYGRMRLEQERGAAPELLEEDGR